MAEFATALCGNPLSAHAPEWVHLMPRGEIAGRDGRHFTLRNPDLIVQTDLPTALASREASFDAFPERSGRVFSKLLVPTDTTAQPPDTRITTAAAESEDTASVCRQLGLDVTALNS